MSAVKFNFSNVKVPMYQWPDAIRLARVTKAEADVSKKAEPMITMELEVFDDQYGSGFMKDWLPTAFPTKVMNFYAAYYGMDVEDLLGQDDIVIDPQDIIGGEVLVVTRVVEDSDGNINPQTGEVYRRLNIVSPFYFPAHRTDLIGKPL